MDPTLNPTLQDLLALPVASLATLHEGAPAVSMVPVVPAPDGSGFLIHISRLASHTRDLAADPRMGLLFTAPLGADGADPLSLPRLSLQGTAEALPDADREAAAGAYLARFPQAELTLGLGDFAFFRLRPESGRLVLGFGRALSLEAAQILGALRG